MTRALIKRYGAVTAVRSVDLDVREGDRYGLLGPNGSGKTTTIRMLLGLASATAGDIRVLGQQMPRRFASVLPGVGALIEGPGFYPFLSGSANLRRLDAADGFAPAASRAARVDYALERVGLSHAAGKKVRAYSLGMKQRLGIANALLAPRELIVLDEPTNGLDPRQVIELRGLLRTLAHDSAVLVTSHILAEMERVADRVAILLDGRLLTVHPLAGPRSGASLRVRARADRADEVAAALSGLPGIGGVTREEPGGGLAGWRVEVAEAGAAPHVAAALCLAGIASVETVEAASDLEELFLRLTASRALQ
jgi:ABC-2 type transport system ATP-binding protein